MTTFISIRKEKNPLGICFFILCCYRYESETLLSVFVQFSVVSILWLELFFWPGKSLCYILKRYTVLSVNLFQIVYSVRPSPHSVSAPSLKTSRTTLFGVFFFVFEVPKQICANAFCCGWNLCEWCVCVFFLLFSMLVTFRAHKQQFVKTYDRCFFILLNFIIYFFCLRVDGSKKVYMFVFI